MQMKNNIDILRKQAGLTVQALAEKTGISRVYLSNLKDGKKELNGRVISKLAEALGCEPHEILGAPIVEKRQFQQVPIVGDCPGGPLMEAIQQPTDGAVMFQSQKKTLFAVRLRGNSFNRIAPDGAYAIADASQTDPAALINQPVVVGINRNGTWESTCKILKRDARGEAFFMPYSTEPHDPIFPGGDEWCIYGRVVGSVSFAGNDGKLIESPSESRTHEIGQ